ncbi:MAG: N-6 DNA methylase [Dehalococcoidia bacterium]|nr:N-6 DNA methylase [Dehalococcoidia bacterium]
MAKRGIEAIRKTISILDSSVDYKRYSEGKARGYLEYASGAWTDERKLIAPILFPKFLEQVLNFKLGETVGTQETAPEDGDIPDYIPTDTRTHPFVFDCKGMDTFDLCKWYDQIKRYLQAQNLKYGILVNMRDLDVYTLESKEEIEAFNFNFVELYKDFKENQAGILEKENTRRFLRFVESFRYTPLTLDQKLKKIEEAKCWNGTETLNIGLLTKRLHYIVERIREDARLRKEELASLKEDDPERAGAIAQEIGMIASEIERGRKIEQATVESFDEILTSSPKSILGRALELFFYRVAYFTMTRLLLARTWEDIGFIDQTLYDGGLAKWYENFNREIRRVLKYAFDLAAERYRWLFNVDNNYTWYEPSDETLIEVLYELSNFYLGNLNQDILGTIYEEYIDKVDKRQKGQYYTPREIVEFIWDRVGFVKDEEFFRYKEGKREPRLIFDPVAGSGGFLVEAVRRIREDSKINYADFNDVLDLRTSILTGVFGSELSPFPYYITEVNLLIQLTPVIKRMMDMKRGFRGKGTPALGVVPVDALSLYNPEQLSLEREEYNFDQTRDLLPLESQKRVVFQKIKKTLDGKFSYCCANPPYVGEKGNKELFRVTLERFPYWREFYQGKMDYLYFFIILGLSKLEEGGKLGFITTAYWPTADGASKLRKYILEDAKICEIIFFEDVKIFEYARGQHNMVFILEKCSGKQRERAENKIKIVRVLAKHQEIPGDAIREKLKFLTGHIEEYIDKNEWLDKYIKVLWSGARQGELSGKPWNSMRGGEADRILKKIRQKGMPLSDICNINQGIVSGADKVTSKNIRLLPQDMVSHRNIKVGDGIFVLSLDELDSLHLSEDEMLLVKPFYKNSDIDRYYVNQRLENPQSVIYITKDIDAEKYPVIKAHLEKFRPILENRLRVYGENYPWYKLHRERDEKIFQEEKIVTPNRALQNTFGLSSAPLYAMSDVFFITGISQSEKLLYILAVLNSTLLDFWFSKTKKGKGEIREYVGTPLSQVPIRRIDFAKAEDAQLHDEIVENAKGISEKMAELSSYSKYFKGTRLTRLKFQDCLPDLNLEAIVQSLPPQNKFSLRTHPSTRITYSPGFQDTQFIVNKVGETSTTLDGAELKLYGKDRKALFITGDGELLKIIAQILKSYRGQSWASIKEMPFVPQSSEEFEAKKQHILDTVSKLRAQIHELQSSIDTIVFRLYDVPESLSG